jgi:hypothetical protein
MRRGGLLSADACVVVLNRSYWHYSGAWAFFCATARETDLGSAGRETRGGAKRKMGRGRGQDGKGTGAGGQRFDWRESRGMVKGG